MKYRTIGDTDLNVSVVSIGSNSFGRKVDQSGCASIVNAAIDEGINFFDTADVYGEPRGTAEIFLGTALGSRRRDVVIATKFGFDMDGTYGSERAAVADRRYIVRAVEGSLRRLGTDYIDLYQIHGPDPSTPLEETMSALDLLVSSGKVRYIGCSKFEARRMGEACAVAKRSGGARLISTQAEYSLLHREVEASVEVQCKILGMALLPFFPLACGLLTGKYVAGAKVPAGSRMDDARYKSWFERAPWAKIGRLRDFADQSSLSMAQVAIGWLLTRPAIPSVIAGATDAAQVAENASAARWSPTMREIQELDLITTGAVER